MRLSARMILSVAVFVLGAVAPCLTAATINQTYSGSLPGTVSGTLPDQGSVLELAITLPTAGDFTASTTSYATGGFQPNLTLYDASGNYVASQWATPPPAATADPGTGSTLDSYLSTMGLSAGSYTLTLTDWELGQSITATNLSDGFTFNLGDGTNFKDVNGNTRTGAFSVTFNEASSASAVPEPATWLLTAPAIGAFLYLRRRRAATSGK